MIKKGNEISIILGVTILKEGKVYYIIHNSSWVKDDAQVVSTKPNHAE